MALRSSLFEAPAAAVTKIAGGPSDALTRWRRTSFDGANFDERAIRSGAATTDGKPANEGAPSPTWLAVMAIRLFPMTDGPRTAATAGWQRVRLYPAYTRRSLVWPAWQPPLAAAAIRTLLTHPALQLSESSGQVTYSRRSSDQLRGLGVTAVFGASRGTRSQGDGPARAGAPHLVRLTSSCSCVARGPAELPQLRTVRCRSLACR